MPITKEFTVLVEDRPSMLGKICQIQHRPGEIARIAAQLGKVDINTTHTVVWSQPQMLLWSFSVLQTWARRPRSLSGRQPFTGSDQETQVCEHHTGVMCRTGV
jgi:hypothetical protein